MGDDTWSGLYPNDTWHRSFFYPSFNETNIAGYSHLVSVGDTTAALVDRARSYLDADCSHCHRPSGPGPTFDARWDTPLGSQNLIYGVLAKGDLGFDHAYVVVPKDIWRSILYQRAHSLDALVKMPPLARNLVDSNSLDVVAAWINSLPGTPALAPPVINPAGGTFYGPVSVAVQPPATNATVYYTVDGSLPTTASAVYSASKKSKGVKITGKGAHTVKAIGIEPGWNDSSVATANFTIN